MLDVAMLSFCYLPVFYVFKAAVFSEVASVSAWVSNGMNTYFKNCWKDWYDVVRVWGPADIVCFSVPLWLRLPVRHIVSFVWTAYLVRHAHRVERGPRQCPSSTDVCALGLVGVAVLRARKEVGRSARRARARARAYVLLLRAQALQQRVTRPVRYMCVRSCPSPSHAGMASESKRAGTRSRRRMCAPARPLCALSEFHGHDDA